MKNIQYIIIFTLLIALGLIFTKTINYENITDELLSENIKKTNKIKYLESQNSTLNQTIINLKNNLSQEKNNTKQLEEQIILLESNLPYIDNDDTNNTIHENNTIEEVEQPNLEENDITGFN